MFRNRSLQFKITFSIVSYIILIGVSGNVLLFVNLQETFFRKAEQTDRAYLEAVRIQLDRNFEEIISLAAVCATAPEIKQAVFQRNRTEREQILDSINVQNQMSTFLQSSPANLFIDKLILFNKQNLFTHALSRLAGEPMDLVRIYQQPLFTRFIADDLTYLSGFGRSINTINKKDCFILLSRIKSPYPNIPDTFIYIETGISMITDVLKDYQVPSGIFVQIPETRKIILQNSPWLIQPEQGKPGYVPADTEFPFRFRQDRRTYRLDRMPLENGTLVLFNQADVTNIAVDDMRILFTVLGTVLVSMIAAIGLAIILSMFLTRPIHTLISRIHKIAIENNFSHEPGIEKNKDEIGHIGYVINIMAGSIGRYLVETEIHYRKQKNTEIALLQTQINPPFLYDTLDSIQKMAEAQNNKTIAEIIQCFINLLKNITDRSDSGTAKGSGMKIALAEELEIIKDYTELMSLRSMGAFEVINLIPHELNNCLIPKFTLQPLVENAIIHGIQPTEKFGTITMNAECTGKFLDITVEDSGLGMNPEQIESLKSGNVKKRSNPSLNYIGIANVEARLKLLYNDSCGISYESKPGEYTKATVRIPAERRQSADGAEHV